MRKLVGLALTLGFLLFASLSGDASRHLNSGGGTTPPPTNDAMTAFKTTLAASGGLCPSTGCWGVVPNSSGLLAAYGHEYNYASPTPPDMNLHLYQGMFGGDGATACDQGNTFGCNWGNFEGSGPGQSCYSGTAYAKAQNWLLIWAGGHSCDGDNSIYGINLNAANNADPTKIAWWFRATTPDNGNSLPNYDNPPTAGTGGAFQGGSHGPVASHTYQGLIWLPNWGTNGQGGLLAVPGGAVGCNVAIWEISYSGVTDACERWPWFDLGKVNLQSTPTTILFDAQDGVEAGTIYVPNATVTETGTYPNSTFTIAAGWPQWNWTSPEFPSNPASNLGLTNPNASLWTDPDPTTGVTFHIVGYAYPPEGPSGATRFVTAYDHTLDTGVTGSGWTDKTSAQLPVNSSYFFNLNGQTQGGCAARTIAGHEHEEWCFGLALSTAAGDSANWPGTIKIETSGANAGRVNYYPDAAKCNNTLNPPCGTNYPIVTTGNHIGDTYNRVSAAYDKYIDKFIIFDPYNTNPAQQLHLFDPVTLVMTDWGATDNFPSSTIYQSNQVLGTTFRFDDVHRLIVFVPSALYDMRVFYSPLL